jgi:hypothetical protein
MSNRLPEWTRYTDSNNQFYFLHEETGESRWMLPESERGTFIDGDEFEPAGRHEEWLKLKLEYEVHQKHEEECNNSDNVTNNRVHIGSRIENNYDSKQYNVENNVHNKSCEKTNENMKNINDKNNNAMRIEILVSTHGITSSAQISHCDRCINMFKIKQIPVTIIDGSATENKITRDKRFKISQTRKYPQIFIVQKANNINANSRGENSTTELIYVGNEEWLQEIIDNDSLDKNVLFNYPHIQTFEGLFSHLRISERKQLTMDAKFSTPTIKTFKNKISPANSFNMEERSLLLRLSSHSDSSSRFSQPSSPDIATGVSTPKTTFAASFSGNNENIHKLSISTINPKVTAAVRDCDSKRINNQDGFHNTNMKHNLQINNNNNTNLGSATPILLTNNHDSIDTFDNVPVFDMKNVDKMYRNADSSSSSSSGSSSDGSDSSDRDLRKKRKKKRKKKKGKKKMGGTMVTYFKNKLKKTSRSNLKE